MKQTHLSLRLLGLAAALTLAAAVGCQSSNNDASLSHPDTTGASLVGMKTFSLVSPTGDSPNLMTGNLTYTQAALHAIQGELEAKGYMYQSAPSADFMVAVTWEYGIVQGAQPATPTTGSDGKAVVAENISISVAAQKSNTHNLLWRSPPVASQPRSSLTERTAADFARTAVQTFPPYAPNKAQ